MRTIVLLSGGLDSSILCAYLRVRKEDVLPLFVERGQRNLAAERRAVGSVVNRLELPAPLVAQVHIPLEKPLGDAFLTAHGRPARNLLLVSIAAQYAALHAADSIALGNVEGDNFADCTKSFRAAAARVLSVALDKDIKVVAPFADWETWTKAEALGWAISNNLSDLVALTWSCWASSEGHCGSCAACRERKEAFKTGGLHDPTGYALAASSS